MSFITEYSSSIQTTNTLKELPVLNAAFMTNIFSVVKQINTYSTGPGFNSRYKQEYFSFMIHHLTHSMEEIFKIRS